MGWIGAMRLGRLKGREELWRLRHSTAKQRVNRVEATSTSGQSGGEEREAGRIT